MQRYDSTAQAIRVAVGETFAIALEGNPSTGYTWQVTTDEQYLELLARDFQPHGQGIGSAGEEIFQFCALSSGQATITCEYRRPWDRQARDTVAFEVQIT